MEFAQARVCVIEQVRAALCEKPPAEMVDLAEAAGRVLAEDIVADRDYPPSDRSIRDGFALRAADVPGVLRVTGEVRAGQAADVEVHPGEAVEITTGAPVPWGADSVVMVEHVERSNGHIRIAGTAGAGQYINPKGAEAAAGSILLRAGQRIGFAETAMLATVGRSQVAVFRKPVVAILATGDEIVEVHENPQAHQIRNSNAYSLAAQVRRAGGEAVILPVARDEHGSTRELISRGLEHDLLLMSGGVSAGKYDIVERVLADLGATFYFDRVLIQPGQPLVFGRARGTFFFGLPGNPASTMVTFEIFARAALELLGGQSDVALPMLWSRLATNFRHKPGLTRFLPAQLTADGSEFTPIRWQGSSDVASMCRANALMVVDADREEWQAGDWMPVILK